MNSIQMGIGIVAGGIMIGEPALRIELANIFLENYKANNPNKHIEYSDVFEQGAFKLKPEYNFLYNEYNAFQHACTSAMITYYTKNPKMAEKLGYLKEMMGWASENPETRVLDTNRDLWNNEKGIRYALDGVENNKSFKEIASSIFQNIFSQDSDFITVLENEDRCYTDLDKITLKNLCNWFARIKDKNIFKFITRDSIYSFFCQAKTTQPIVIDPLLVDLNGDGIKTTTVENGIFFDHENDGFMETSAWVDENDGVLAIDKNNNGNIDNGNEIFGDNYIKTDGSIAKSGFDALADLDSNNDGVINSNDEKFNEIKVLKGDGSLISLEEAGIQSIRLSSSSSNTVDENGNTIVSIGTFVRTDGTTGQLGDYSLQVDKLNSFAAEWLDETEEITALPDVMGSGAMYSLHQAILRDETGELKGILENYLNEPNSINRRNIAINLIYKWAGVENIASSSRGGNIDARKLSALEKFMGEKFVGVEKLNNPNSQAANILEAAFTSLVNNIYATIESQTTLKPIYDLITIEFNEETNEYSYNLNAIQEHIDNVILQDITSGKELLKEIGATLLGLGLKEVSNYSDFYNHFASMDSEYKLILDAADKIPIQGTEQADEIEGTANGEVIYAGAGDDIIFSRQGDDIIFGGDGDDYIDACEGNDIIHGGAGNDTIISTSGVDYIVGGKGDDIITAGGNPTTYEYNLGDGNDIITDRCPAAGDVFNDTIIFGEGINKDNIEFLNGGNDDLLIQFKGEEGSIRIKKGLTNSEYRIENYKFADGTSYTYDEISSLTETRGTIGDDTITDTVLSEKIYGYDGNDTITSTKGEDYIVGGKGDDIITAGGNPTTYEYNLGDGNDIITDRCPAAGDVFNDTIIFGEGISKDNIEFLNGGEGDLLIAFKNHDGSIRIKGGLVDSYYRIENYKFADGTSYTYDEISSLTETRGTQADDVLTDTVLSEKIYGYDGNDTITSTGGQDYIVGGKGDDVITAGGNPTTYEYNLGDGNDTITDRCPSARDVFNDTIVFGEGISKDNIEFLNGGNDDLLIQFKNQEGSIRIKKGLTNSEYRIENYKFADGTSYTYDEISSLIEIRGTIGDDVLTDSYLNEKIYGYDGDDTISSTGGRDYIIGGKGDDVITASGNPTTYEYNLGDGDDTITDYCPVTGDVFNDTIIFGEGISKDNILFANDNGDLLITFDGFEGSIRVVNGVSISNYHIENYKFADNSSLTYDQVRNLLTTTTAITAGYDTGAESNTNMADYDVNLIIQDMSSYGIQEADIIPMNENNYSEDLMALVASR